MNSFVYCNVQKYLLNSITSQRDPRGILVFLRVKLQQFVFSGADMITGISSTLRCMHAPLIRGKHVC